MVSCQRAVRVRVPMRLMVETVQVQLRSHKRAALEVRLLCVELYLTYDDMRMELF